MITDIKVGQIYFDEILGGEIAITWIAMDKKEYHCIRKDGFIFYSSDFSTNKMELIAEYPTWQEAVNSPEFRGERI